MQAQFLSALLVVVSKYTPFSLRWAVQKFVETVSTYLDKNPSLIKTFDSIVSMARGFGDAPNALKDWIKTVLDGAKQGIRNPLLLTVYSTIEGFVVNQLVDQLWNVLFGPGTPTPSPMTMAARPMLESDAAPWQHSLAVAVHAAGDKWEDFPEPCEEPKPNEQTAEQIAPAGDV